MQRTALQRLNSELCLTALERGEGFALHRPIHVAVQVASGCNLDCYMCLEHVRPMELREERQLKSLPRELFDVLAEEVLPYSSRLTFGIGGEPTLARHFQDFLQRGFELGQEIELITNATRFDQDGLAETIARCVAYLQISIDGATRETYERVRAGASFARVLANIELLERYCSAYPREERTHVSFWVTVMKSNAGELPALVELAGRLGLDRVHAHHVTPVTPEGAADSLLDAPELWNEVRSRAIERAHALSIEIDLPEPLPVAEREVRWPNDGRLSAGSDPIRIEEDVGDPRARVRTQDARYAKVALHAVACHLPATAIYVLWDGRVVPCCYPYGQEKMTLGNLGEQSFAEIWNGRLYRNLRVGMKRGDVLCVCRHCPVVHDVPVTPEEDEEMRASPTLAEWFDDRDLAPLEQAFHELDVLDRLRRGGALAELDDLRRHARNLESERPHLLGHIANLERDRAPLLEHARNLENELERRRAKRRWLRPAARKEP
jgi:MoaA/NifB/PqqE/SkfB family radical SAM enzyme